MLQAVATESARNEHIAHVRVPANHRVLVERVVFVKTSPRRFHSQRLERGDATRQRRPHDLVEKLVVRVLQILDTAVTVVLGTRAHAAQEAALRALGPEIHAARVDREWRRVGRGGAGGAAGAPEGPHAALPRFHWQLGRPRPAHLHDTPAVRTRRVDDGARVDNAAVRERQRVHPAIGREAQARHRLLHVGHPPRLGALAHGLKQRPWVEVPLVTLAEGASGDAIDGQPGEALGQLGRVQQRDPVRPCGMLNCHILPQHALPIAGGRQDEVAVLPELHVCLRARPSA
mmetsp:Transcript_94003/g.255172  ORF Transcript_94003/g.255172 Transcript_94003/m.255172 type:complete len:288 (+) Transcript_94003:216-1079(+)